MTRKIAGLDVTVARETGQVWARRAPHDGWHLLGTVTRPTDSWAYRAVTGGTRYPNRTIDFNLHRTAIEFIVEEAIHHGQIKPVVHAD